MKIIKYISLAIITVIAIAGFINIKEDIWTVRCEMKKIQQKNIEMQYGILHKVNTCVIELKKEELLEKRRKYLKENYPTQQF